MDRESVTPVVWLNKVSTKYKCGKQSDCMSTFTRSHWMAGYPATTSVVRQDTRLPKQDHKINTRYYKLRKHIKRERTDKRRKCVWCPEVVRYIITNCRSVHTALSYTPAVNPRIQTLETWVIKCCYDDQTKEDGVMGTSSTLERERERRNACREDILSWSVCERNIVACRPVAR
jgi:hypothetical protein